MEDGYGINDISLGKGVRKLGTYGVPAILERDVAHEGSSVAHESEEKVGKVGFDDEVACNDGANEDADQ